MGQFIRLFTALLPWRVGLTVAEGNGTKFQQKEVDWEELGPFTIT
jgi:hypothetical protein